MSQQIHSWAYIQRKTVIWKDAGTPVPTAAPFTIPRQQPKCPLTEKRRKKTWYIHTMEYYSAVKKNETMPLEALWTDPGIITVREGSQKDEYPVHHWYVKPQVWHKWTYLQNKLTDTEDKLRVIQRDGEGRTGVWVSRYKLLHIWWISDKTLL